MSPLNWTPQALSDVQRLHRFLEGKDPEAAIRAVRTIREGVRILAVRPQIGHPIDGLDPAYREWLIPFGQSGYLVLYRVEANAVILLAVRHGREAGYKM